MSTVPEVTPPIPDDDDAFEQLPETPAEARQRRSRYMAWAPRALAGPTRLDKLLLAVTGVDAQGLRADPWEFPLYTAVGSALLLNAVVSALGVYVALTLTFESGSPLWGLVALVFGLFVLSLDRYLFFEGAVLHTGLSARRILAVMPRIALAVIIGMLVSVVLLMALFRPEVSQASKVAVSSQIAVAQEAQSSLGARLVRLRDENTATLAQLDETQRRLSEAEQRYAAEVTGEGSGVPGKGPRAVTLRREVDRLRALREQYEEGLRQLQAEQQEVASELAAREAQLLQSMEQRRALESEDETPELLLRLQGVQQLRAQSHNFAIASVALAVLLSTVQAMPALLTLLVARRSNSYKVRMQQAREHP